MRNTIKSLTAIALASAVAMSWAASVSLYQSPDVKSQVTAKVKTGQRLIPIFQSKDHQGWIKVANPTNGTVGWMKIQNNKPKPATKTATKKTENGFVQRTITTTEKEGPKTYRVIEYSGNEKLSNKQVEKLMAQMEQRNAQMQQDMDRMMNDMRTNFFGFQPIITPPVVERVVVVPVAPEVTTANSSEESATPSDKKSFWQKIKKKVS